MPALGAVKVKRTPVLRGGSRDRVDGTRAEHRAHLAVALHANDARRVHVAVQDGALTGDDLPVVEHVVISGNGVYFGRIGTYDPTI